MTVGNSTSTFKFPPSSKVTGWLLPLALPPVLTENAVPVNSKPSPAVYLVSLSVKLISLSVPWLRVNESTTTPSFLMVIVLSLTVGTVTLKVTFPSPS